MARILQQARRSPLFSPSRLQTLIRPLSPTPPPPLPSLSPSSPAPAAARSYIAAMRRSAFQENLLRILRTEIDYEVDVRPPQEPVPKFKSFVVEDRPGERWITLRGKHGGKEIKVDASMFDYAFPVPNGDKTEESRGENMKLHISLVVDVGCGGGGGDPVLQFICSAWPDELEIEHFRVVQNGRPLLCPFMGPRFKDVDEKMQDALLEYLEERGVDDELAAFLHQYMMNKDRREFVRWMENVKSYLEKMSGNDLIFNPDGSAVNPGAFQQHIRRDSQMMAQLLQTDPALAQVILGNDLDRLQNLLRERHQQRSELRHKQQEELALMYADPFDVESQKKIEAAIRQKGIDENWEAALEYNPEAFARVVMLYVDMEVNGVPLKAFVDSGAQSTIISKSCAERCGLLRLLDKRYHGIAVGVGQSEILGRIHMAPIKIGNIFYPCSFTVLDASNVDFLFGLDMLRKHQCIIDLKENVLRVGGGEVSVPFLQEKDIPSHFRDEERFSKQASIGRGSVPETSGQLDKSAQLPSGSQHSGTSSNVHTQEADFEAKIAKLVELGFGREAVIQALKLFNGNEEQAAGFLFGG